MPFRQVSGMRRYLISDHPITHVFLIRQSQMFLRRNIADHSRPMPSDLRATNSRRDMIVSRSDIGRQRAQRIERRSMAGILLFLHILMNLIHGNMARAFDNHLYELLPSYFRQFSHRVKLGELCRVVRVIDRTGAKPVSDRDRHVICL